MYADSNYKNIDLKKSRTKPYVRYFVLRRIADPDANLDDLKQYENYTGTDLTPEEIAKYAKQDRERLEDYYNGRWYMFTIRAECEFAIPYDDGKSAVLQKLTSGGLGGNPSDSDDDYTSEEDSQLEELKSYCRKLGIQYSKNTPISRE